MAGTSTIETVVRDGCTLRVITTRGLAGNMVTVEVCHVIFPRPVIEVIGDPHKDPSDRVWVLVPECDGLRPAAATVFAAQTAEAADRARALYRELNG